MNFPSPTISTIYLGTNCVNNCYKTHRIEAEHCAIIIIIRKNRITLINETKGNQNDDILTPFITCYVLRYYLLFYQDFSGFRTKDLYVNAI